MYDSSLSPEFIQELVISRELQQPKVWKGIFFLYGFFVYVCLTLCFALSAYDDRNAEDTYYMYDAVKRALITDDFANIKSRTEAVTYISENVASVLFRDLLFGDSAKLVVSEPTQVVMTSLTIMSTARVRQLKVREGCQQASFTKPFGGCIPPFSEDTMDTAPFIGTATQTVYNYTESEFPNNKLTGRLSTAQYPLGGHVMEIDIIQAFGTITALTILNNNSTTPLFTNTLDIAKAGMRLVFLDPVLNDNWVRSTTRFLACELSLMMNHGSRPIFGGAIVMFEFPTSGGCLPSFQMVPFTPGETMSSYHVAVIVFMSLVGVQQIVTIVARFARRKP
eukprot:PhF_6_TR26384/c0_g1_i3/m.38066